MLVNMDFLTVIYCYKLLALKDFNHKDAETQRINTRKPLLRSFQ